MHGLENKNYVVFEETGHSSDPFMNGKKFEVFDINFNDGNFKIKETIKPNMQKVLNGV